VVCAIAQSRQLGWTGHCGHKALAGWICWTASSGRSAIGKSGALSTVVRAPASLSNLVFQLSHFPTHASALALLRSSALLIIGQTVRCGNSPLRLSQVDFG
jgi:hypothetical protein